MTAVYDQQMCDSDRAQGGWDDQTSMAISCNFCGLQAACDEIAGQQNFEANGQQNNDANSQN